jgi:hypothetical protein
MLELRNPRKKEVGPVQVSALADTWALHLCIPEQVRQQLQLEPLDQKEVTPADGSQVLVPYAILYESNNLKEESLSANTHP